MSLTLLAVNNVEFHIRNRFFLMGEGREGCGIHKWPKKPKLAHITDYLTADLSADAHPRINIREIRLRLQLSYQIEPSQTILNKH